MPFWFQRRIRHPFYPKLFATPATEAQGRVIALSGTFHQLERAAADGVSAQNALFVITRLNGSSLTEAQRDHLWTLFLVPVYAMLVDEDDRVIGFECEAQHGFHVPGRVAPDSPLCECGRPGRLLQTEAEEAISMVRALPAAV
jgi:hypothetical protein